MDTSTSGRSHLAAYELRVVRRSGRSTPHTNHGRDRQCRRRFRFGLRETKKRWSVPVSGVVSYKALTKQRKLATKFLMAATDFRRKAKAKEAVEKYEAGDRRRSRRLRCRTMTWRCTTSTCASRGTHVSTCWRPSSSIPNSRWRTRTCRSPISTSATRLGAEISAEHALELNHDNEKAAYLLQLRAVTCRARRRGRRRFHKTGD